jgi:hypothetical protein
MSQAICQVHTEDHTSIPILGTSVPPGKNERMCVSCRRNFWAWDTGRDRCYLCEPLDPIETERVLAAIGVRLPEHLSLRLAAPTAR